MVAGADHSLSVVDRPVDLHDERFGCCPVHLHPFLGGLHETGTYNHPSAGA